LHSTANYGASGFKGIIFNGSAVDVLSRNILIGIFLARRHITALLDVVVNQK
jgi:hypothetical protein